MVVHSPCIAGESSSLTSIRKFLVDYRVMISFILFTTLVIAQIYVGTKPRGWWIGGDIQGLIGFSLVIIGLLVRSWAAAVLQKGKTLATFGPYSLCKHPLYLGSFCLMVGFWLLLGNPLPYAIVVGSIALIYWFTMASEERKLDARFGDRWREYSKGIPRLLPWRWSNYRHAPLNLKAWLSNREYKALLTAICGLIAVELWRLH